MTLVTGLAGACGVAGRVLGRGLGSGGLLSAVSVVAATTSASPGAAVGDVTGMSSGSSSGSGGLLAGLQAAEAAWAVWPGGALLSQWLGKPTLGDGWGGLLWRVALVVAAAAAGEALRVVVQSAGERMWERITELTTTTATLDSDDEAYRWLLLWLADHPSFKTSHSYQVTSSMHKYARSVAGEEEEENGNGVWFTPGSGSHWFRFRNKYVLLRRTSSGSRYSNEGIRGTDRISIMMLGKATARSQISSLIEEARLTAANKDKSRTVVYVGDQYGNWARSTARSIRPLSSVILEEGVEEKLVRDAKDFLRSAKWYSDRGIPYRRGYLLHGKPGCGKTSFITALAGEVRMNIYVINLASKALNDEVLAELMRGVPYRGIVLFEDIDAAFVPNGPGDGSESDSEDEGRGRARENLGNGVTFSGLLNVLDGVASAEGRVVFFTTNHFSRLSKALIRPGRVDVIVKVGLATVTQARRMFHRFYEELDEAEALADRFAASFLPDSVSMAQLQAYLMNYKEDPHGALRDAPTLLFPATTAAKAAPEL